ncbi:MAG: zinc ABC transporter solute-binding protein [Campylobacteraceae bacterium]|nr:zinc ABC transporter solute-binding protein [Campylobacteraceae bacterium]
MKKIAFLSLVACVSLFGKPLVTTTILPTKYFVEQIVGDEVEVEALVLKGSNPVTYEVKPSQMKSVERSDLHFSVGVEFDRVSLVKLQNQFPSLKVVDTGRGIEKIAMASHHHGGDKQHNHRLDPHIWLDPVLVKTQAENIAEALIKEYPEKKELFESNLAKFKDKLDEFDKATAEKLKELKTNKFMIYHPSWGYFSKRYGLVQIPIEMEGKEPKPADLKKLTEEAKKEDIRVIFISPQFSQKSAKAIAEQTGTKVVEIDQLPEEWFSEMKKIVDIFVENLK